MGVMLSLDQPRLARNRRQARHARRPDDQAWADALAAVLTGDAPHPGGCLVRLAKTVFAGWLLPAKAGPGWPADRGPARNQEPGGPADLAAGPRPARAGSELSGACLLGQCADSPGGPACASATCKHDCHAAAPAAPASGAPAA
jgi:hypothetical protein